MIPSVTLSQTVLLRFHIRDMHKWAAEDASDGEDGVHPLM